MAVPALLVLLAAFTVASGMMMFLNKKLLHSVLFLALAAIGSSLIFIYISQTLVALLQLLVFVGSLCTYLIVVVAMEDEGNQDQGHSQVPRRDACYRGLPVLPRLWRRRKPA